MRAILAVMRREWWVNTRAYRLSFFGATLLSAVFTLLGGHVLYRSIFGGSVTEAFVGHAGTGDYMTYLTVGVLANAFAFRILYPVRNVLEEHHAGTLPVLTLTGLSTASFQTGCIAFSACYAFVEVLIMLGVTLPWSGASFAHANPVGVVLALVAALPALLGFSTLLSALVLIVRNRLVVESVAFSLMALVGGVAFPARYLPMPLQALGEMLPLTWFLRILRAATLDGAPVADLLGGVAALLLIGIVHGLLGLALLRVAIRRALEVTA